MKKWKVAAEVDMDASKIVTIEVSANSERKARIIATEKLKQDHFFVNIISIKQLMENLNTYI